MTEDMIGTAEIAKLTGLTQRMVRYLAEAGDIPFVATPRRVVRRGLWFDRAPLLGSAWIRNKTVDPYEPKRRGRKPKTAYKSFKAMVTSPPNAALMTVKDLATFAKVFAGKLNQLVRPGLEPKLSGQLHHALKPLERAIANAGRAYVAEEYRKLAL